MEMKPEQIHSEYNYWRELAQEREIQIADLNRKIERLEIWARVWSKIINIVDQEIERIQIERDNAKADNDIG